MPDISGYPHKTHVTHTKKDIQQIKTSTSTNLDKMSVPKVHKHQTERDHLHTRRVRTDVDHNCIDKLQEIMME